MKEIPIQKAPFERKELFCTQKDTNNSFKRIYTF